MAPNEGPVLVVWGFEWEGTTPNPFPSDTEQSSRIPRIGTDGLRALWTELAPASLPDLDCRLRTRRARTRAEGLAEWRRLESRRAACLGRDPCFAGYFKNYNDRGTISTQSQRWEKSQRYRRIGTQNSLLVESYLNLGVSTSLNDALFPVFPAFGECWSRNFWTTSARRITACHSSDASLIHLRE